MDLEFSIVLFENEGYATARGDKGVQDILASSADAGYIKDGTYPIIFASILLEMVDQPEAGGNELFYVHPRFLA